MKLRIRGNSIRLRLAQSEVTRLLDQGVVVESTTFDPAGRQRLDYQLISTANVAAVAVSFEEGRRLVVRVPADLVAAWGMSDRIEIAATQPAEGGAVLRILIEKDLECLDPPPEESQADAFKRPDGAPAC